MHFQAHRLPEGLRYGLEARESFDPPGTFSNACHAALVAIDPGTGEIRLRRYLVVEDCGVVINPMIVDGQVRGGVTQGVAAALLEQIRYDADGQPGSATLMDYLAPTAAEMCPIEIVHLETPSRVQRDRGQGHGRGRHDRRARPPCSTRSTTRSPAPARSFDHIPVLPGDIVRRDRAAGEAASEGHAPDQAARQRPGARAGRRGPPDARRHAPARPRVHRHAPGL